MGYCTKDDIILKKDETFLEKYCSKDKIVDNAKLNIIISDISLYIDGFLDGVYPIPFTGDLTILKRICRDLAICELLDGKSDKGTPEGVLRDKQELIKELGKIRSGEIKLPVTDTTIDRPAFRKVKSPSQYYTDELSGAFRG